MALPLSSLPQQMQAPAPRRIARAMVIGAAVLAAFLVLGALALWLSYGTAVFFEMIVSGIAACF